MKWSLSESKIKRLIKNRNIFIRFAFIELFIILFLCAGVLYAFYQQRIVIVPAALERSFWIAHNDVSSEYLSEMTHFFMDLRLTVSPANAAMQRELLLRHTDPQYYAALKTLLVNEGDRMTKDRISMSFFPTDIAVHPETLTARVSGDLVTTVGATVMPAQPVYYEVRYNYRNGRLFITSLGEIKK